MTASLDQPDARRHAWTAAAVLAVLGAVVDLTGIFSNVYNDRAQADQNIYHLRVIDQFSGQFPKPDLSDYYSATGPGYHLALAVVHRFITQDVDVIRSCSAVFTIALFATLGFAVGRQARWPTAVAVCLPMLTSLYVFVSGVWLLPDNCAWLTVLAAVLIAFRNANGATMHIATAAIVAAAVFVRQINLWPLGVLVVGKVISDTPDEPGRFKPHFAPRWPARAAAVLLTGIPALLILGWFYRMWHGLTPPAFQTVKGVLPAGHSSWQHEGPNFAVPAMVLSVLAATGFFFLPFLIPTIRDTLARRGTALKLVALGVIIGASTALIVPTDFTPAPGPRYSGLWNVSAYFTVIAHRSLLIVALAGAGGAVVMTWFVALGSRARWIWLASWLCFAAAQSANAKAWHKYYEPFCLMMLALAAGRVAHRVPKWAVVGPVLLAILLGVVTYSNLGPQPEILPP